MVAVTAALRDVQVAPAATEPLPNCPQPHPAGDDDGSMGYSARVLLDNIPGAAAVVDAEGRIVAVNPRWAAATELESLLALLDREAHQVCLVPLDNGGGARDRLVTVEPAEAHAVAQAKSEFLALLGHELRTPVSSVVGMVEVLRAIPLPQEAREVVDGVHRSTRLLKSMTDDLLDLARLETDRLDLDERPVLLRGVLEDVVEPVQQQVRQKGILLLAGVAPDVPPWIVADAGRLRQVLTNLVGNAVKFTQRGEVVVTASREMPDRLLITVSDTGPGLTEHDRSRVFAPFVQADSSSVRRHEGAGLGLAIAARLVARMGGTIELDSAVGRGSEFRLRLPLVAAPDRIDAVVAEVVRTAQGNGARRVALTAPSPRSTQVLTWLLLAIGVDVVPASLADLAEVADRAPDIDTILWCDDSHSPEAAQRAAAVLAAVGPDRLMIMISTTDPRRGIVRGPALITAPLTLRRLAAVVNQERTGVRGAPVAAPRLPGGRVLLAEDNVVNQGVFRRMITLLGADCDVVGDGALAITAVLGAEPYDAVLMDMQMPGVDGLEATRKIRAAGVDTPILALTATALRGDQERCLAAGMNGYLSKPITLGELHRALATYLDPSPDSDGLPNRPAVPPVTDPPADSPEPAVDLHQLRNLEDELADRPLVVIAVSTYLSELNGRRAAMADALGRQDRDALRAAAHTLKSSSALLGATALARACIQVEQRSSDAGEAELAGLIAAVERGAVATSAALTEYVADSARRG